MSFSDDGWGSDDDVKVAESPVKINIEKTIEPPLLPVQKEVVTPKEEPPVVTMSKPFLPPKTNTVIEKIKEQQASVAEESDDGWASPVKKTETKAPTLPKPSSVSQRNLSLPPPSGIPIEKPVDNDTFADGTLDLGSPPREATPTLQTEKPAKIMGLPPQTKSAASSRRGCDFNNPDTTASVAPVTSSFGGVTASLKPTGFGGEPRGLPPASANPGKPSFGRQLSGEQKPDFRNSNDWPKPAEPNASTKSSGFGGESAGKTSGGSFGQTTNPSTGFGKPEDRPKSGFSESKLPASFGGVVQTAGFGGASQPTRSFGGESKMPSGFGGEVKKASGFGGEKADGSGGSGGFASKPTSFGEFQQSSGSGSFGGAPASGFAKSQPAGFGGETKTGGSAGFGGASSGGAASKSSTFGGEAKPGGPAGFGGASASGFASSQPSGFGGEVKTGGSASGFSGASSGGISSKSLGFGGEAKTRESAGFGGAPASGFAKSQPSGFGGEVKTGGSAGFGGASSGGFASKPTNFGGEAKTGGSTGFGGGSSGGFSTKSSGFGGETKPTSGFGSSQPGGFGGESRSTTGFGGAKKSTGFGDSTGFGGGTSADGYGGKTERAGAFGSGGGGGFGGGGSTGASGFGGKSEGPGKFGDGGGGGFGGGAFGGDSGFENAGNTFGGERERRSGCFNCGEEGHRKEECTAPKKSFGPCRNCGEEGHMVRDCPHPPTTPCRNCKKEGHWMKDCPEPKVIQSCHNCGEEGHFSRDCEKEKVRQEPTEPCRRCNEEGHWAFECPTRPRDLQGNLLMPYEVVFVPDEEMFNDAVDNDSRIDFDQKVVASMGDSIVPDMASFEAFKLLPSELSCNLKRMKMNRPTPIQRASFFPIFNGLDVVACAHTGCGKTLAFLIPLVTKLLDDLANHDGVPDEKPMPGLLIIAPTRELASQTFNTARQLTYETGLKCGIAYGGYSRSANLQHLLSFDQLNILVATMGRLQDFLESGDISLEKMKFVVLDEADRMVDSADFGEEVTRILGPPEQRTAQTCLFSASFSENLQREDLPNFVKEGYTMLQVNKFGTANENIDQQILAVPRSEKRSELCKLIGLDENNYTKVEGARIDKEKTLIFVNTVKFSDSLASFLSQNGISAFAMHSHQNQENRDLVLNDFRRGKYTCMVASNVCARGLNIPGLDHVINYDMPDKNGFDEYVNRIGRTGRAGYSGFSTAFIDEEADREIIPSLVNILEEAKKEVPEWLSNMNDQGDAYNEEAGEDQW